MTKKYGIKGFDKNLKCRDFQYKVGETYTQNEKPRLCHTGFHYSRTLSDARTFYGNSDDVFCVVEILGEVDEGLDKSCTNKIKILRKVGKGDLKKEIPAEELFELCEAGFVIGGSLALRIHGYKLRDVITEVDLITTKENVEKNCQDFFVGYKEINRFSGMDSVKCYVGIMGQKYDILVGKTDNYVTRYWYGYELKVQDENIIWQHKLKYALSGSIKHLNDIKKAGIDFIVKPETKKSKRLKELELPF